MRILNKIGVQQKASFDFLGSISTPIKVCDKKFEGNLTIPSFKQLQKKDLELAAFLARNAYIEEKLAEYFFPDPKTRSQKLFDLFYFRLNTQRQFCLTTSPKIVGLTIWEPPDSHHQLITSKEFFLGIPLLYKIGYQSLKRILNFTFYITTLRKSLMKEPHWYFDFVAVDPNFRRCQIGSSLIEYYLKRVNIKNLPIYLEVQNTNYIGLYESLGFQIVHQSKIPEIEIMSYCMVRK